MSASTHDYAARLVDDRLAEYLKVFPAVMLTGPRAVGKTTTAMRHAESVVRLDQPAAAAAFRADPDAALRDRPEPTLLDEWQEVPEVLGAVKRAVDADPRPGRFILTGSVRAELDQRTWPGTGRVVRLPMFGLTEREIDRTLAGRSIIDVLAHPDDPVRLPRQRPDLAGYVDLAIRGGFPAAALGQMTPAQRMIWLANYIDGVVTRDVQMLGADVDELRLREYFQAVVAHSASEVTHKTLYDAAGIDRKTAAGYDRLLDDLFVVERVPALHANQIKRLTATPKRYVVDPAFMTTAIGASRHEALSDGVMLGRLIDTFVMAQLRPEVALATPPTSRFHLRTGQGRQEVDIVLQLPTGIVGIEVKASSAPTSRDARHLSWLRDELGDRFIAGVVLHTGPDVFALGDRIRALPICALWRSV